MKFKCSPRPLTMNGITTLSQGWKFSPNRLDNQITQSDDIYTTPEADSDLEISEDLPLLRCPTTFDSSNNLAEENGKLLNLNNNNNNSNTFIPEDTFITPDVQKTTPFNFPAALPDVLPQEIVPRRDARDDYSPMSESSDLGKMSISSEERTSCSQGGELGKDKQIFTDDEDDEEKDDGLFLSSSQRADTDADDEVTSCSNLTDHEEDDDIFSNLSQNSSRSFRDELSADLIDLLQILEISKTNTPEPSDTPSKNGNGKSSSDQFDIFDIETALPTIDWDAMEARLAEAAKEEEWVKKRRNDREEIRKKLAMETEEELDDDDDDEEDDDDDEYYCGEKMTRKPSLTTRLQSNMNLQICFLNETASDLESLNNEENLVIQDEPPPPLPPKIQDSPQKTPTNEHPPKPKLQRPSFFFNRRKSWRLGKTKQVEAVTPKKEETEEEFHIRHARLQAEARLALAQAKDMARMQMDVEKQSKKKSPIAEIVGFPYAETHRLARARMSDMNVAQLQVIVNDLHSQIESLNEDLVHLLLERDDLHMEQDSMLVDIEDLNRYLGAKCESLKAEPLTSPTKV